MANAAPAQPIVDALAGLLKGAATLAGRKATTEADPPAQPDGKVPPELAYIDTQVQDIRDGMTAMRDDLAAFGKTLGAILTVVFAGIGYTQIHDIFPFPRPTSDGLTIATIVAAALGLSAAVFLVFRFFFARRRIIISPSTATRKPWSLPWNTEKRILAERCIEYAKREGFGSLDDAQRHAWRLVRKYKAHPNSAAGKKHWEDAYRLERIIDLALWDAASDILEHRTHKAFGGKVGILALALAVGGTAWVFAMADWAKAQRNLAKPTPGRIAVSCAQHAEASAPSDARPDLYAACAKLIAP